MTYRTDKFATGDIVIWSEKHGDIGRSMYPSLGEGPFTIESVIDRPYDPPPYDDEYYYGHGQSNWSAMGHTQHVIIKEAKCFNNMFSGAYFC